VAEPLLRRQSRIGILVNPIAGLGGRVGLKGTDGPEAAERARRLGATPEAGRRAVRAMTALVSAYGHSFDLLAGVGPLGATWAVQAGLTPGVVGPEPSGPTTADDTKRAAKALLLAQVDLLCFVGGDGTARDILDAIGSEALVLGIPAGVKMYSACFAVSPEQAGRLMADTLAGLATPTEAEVLDLELTERAPGVSPTFYGVLRVPYRRGAMTGGKEPSPKSEEGAASAIAREVASRMDPGVPHIVGPGTTTRALAAHLGLAKTLIGVDVMTSEALLIEDAREVDLVDLVEERPARVVVTPIGGQGFIFGRGSQPISAKVLRHLPRENIVVVATEAKLARLAGRPMLVDTGDPEVDSSLRGYVRVITGNQSEALYPVS
jgi:predicted polyphosphate/ATP-dependent NAD kinase